jgi:hypothetical protein
VATLNELAWQAFSTNSGTTGTLNEVTYAYLAQVTGLSGITLQEQWAAALAVNGFSTGTVNERQMAYWASLGYTGTWNERYIQWLTLSGGAFGPNLRIQQNGSAPDVAYCDYAPAGTCAAAATYTALDTGFTNPADTWLWTIEPPVAGVVLTDSTLKTCTVTSTTDADTAFNLKCVATDSVSTDSAERTTQYTHYHREDLAVTDIAEQVAGDCTWDSTIGQTACAAQGAYKASVTGTPDTYTWSISDITGGSATLGAGQGTNTIIVDTNGSANVQFKLTCDITSEFQSDSLSENFTQTHADAPTPVFIGPAIDTTILAQNVAMTPFDVSGRFTGQDAGGYSLEGTWPAGLSIDTNGVLSGTPTDPVADYDNLTFRASNANGSTDSNTFTVTISSGEVAPVFSGTVPDQNWNLTDPVTLDLRPYFSGSAASYTLTAGTLPTGVTLGVDGIITGTPTQSGTFAGLEVTATNGAGADTTNAFSADVLAVPVFVGPDLSSPVNITQGVAMTPIDVSGKFTGTVTAWSLEGTWPTGITISGAGVVSGTSSDSVADYTNLTVRASNASGNADSNAITVSVAASPTAPVWAGSLANQQWIRNEAITPISLYADFGSPTLPTTFAVATGTLPTGVTLNTSTGEVSGTPTTNSTDTGISFSCTNSAGSDTTNTFDWEVADSFGPAFWALTPDETTYEMLGVKTGVGDLTCSRTADLYAPDYQGIQRVYVANSAWGGLPRVEPVWAGGRQVVNLVRASDDLTVIGSGASINITTNSVEYLTGSGYYTQSNSTASGYLPVAGSICVLRVKLWSNDMTQIGIRMVGCAQNNQAVTIDSTPRVYTYTSTATSSAIAFGLDTRVGIGGAGQTGTVFCENVQIEIIPSGDIPSEYVPVGTDINDRYNLKVFANLNGNTVLNNVVTEAVGAPLSETPYLQYYPAAQNDVVDSNDFPSWTAANGLVATADQSGLTGEPNTASTVQRGGSASATWIGKPFGGAGSVTKCRVVYAKAGTGSWIQVTTSSGGYYANFDLTNGVVGDTHASVTAEIIDMGGGIYKCISLSSNSDDCNVILYQGESHENKTIAEVRGLGPIFTTTAAVATDFTDYTFDITNHDDTQGAYYDEFTLPYSFPETKQSSNGGLIATRSNTFQVTHSLASGTDGVSTFDQLGAGSLASGSGYVAYDPLKGASVYHQTEDKLVANMSGVYGSETTFGGYGTNLNVIRCCRNGRGVGGTDNLYPLQIRELQRYDITSFAEGKTIIDGLMV